MKNKSPEKKNLARQLISGTVYTALAAVVVAVTVNTTVGLISNKTDLPKIDNTSDITDTDIPSIPDIPPLSLPEFNNPVQTESELDTVVSDTVDGIDALITEPAEEAAENNVPDAVEQVDAYGIPPSANLGLDKFIKPCSGYISREHSAEIPVYSPTMSDYRTHIGIDVVGDIGSEVVCVNGGIVKSIYNDDLFGVTVEMINRDGICIRYSNLQPELDAAVKVGAILKTGDPVGGIGETAICETVDTPHVHLEIYGANGTPVDPEELIMF